MNSNFFRAAAGALLLASTSPILAHQPDASAVTVADVPKEQTARAYRLALGDFQIVALSDGTVPLDLHKIMTGTNETEIDALLARSFLANPVETSINAYVIEADGRVLLVDTGAGELFGLVGGKLVKSLAAAGYRSDQIDDILITHIHADHSGGLAIGGKMLFPNATIHVGKGDVDFFLDKANAAKSGYNPKAFDEAERTVAPYVRAGKVKTFSGQTEIFPGIMAVPTPGHTPGHAFFHVESKGQAIEFWGDILHIGSLQFPKPDITINFDVDSPAARSQRLVQFAKAVGEKKLVAASHLPFPGIGHLRAEGRGYSWVPVDFRDRVGD